MFFVDKIRYYSNCKLKYKYWCHLWTDETEEKLIEFAEKIGLKSKWIQRKSLLHFDLVPSKRKLAIKNGAKEKEIKEYLK